ncbi:MAG: efflux RND transporter permease subunit, partial [gamma proteobacterium endosymbiont of Lamellibrachia anaximandri]|nr:efflux RND transporter permease subunit [gamma proteobacterium endosymbiont of Lamellibrachia anaximandri]
DWTPRSDAYFASPLAQGTPGKQCGLAATGDYQPSLRSPWLAAREAVIKGAVLRVRPKIMTVASVILGLLPILLASGAGSDVMRPIAAPMVGGMLSAALLTLVVVPAAFFVWKERQSN